MELSLVLSLFPGLGLLDKAFELEGFCVVRGPDVLWGGDIQKFHPPADRFDGIIGGPPCQSFSKLRHLMKACGLEPQFGNLIPEFERCVSVAKPDWFVMENVPDAPLPNVEGYSINRYLVDDWKCGGKTQRRRTFCVGGIKIEIDQSHWPTDRPRRAVTSNLRAPQLRHYEQAQGKGGVLPGQGIMLPISEACELQGIPSDFFEHSPFKVMAIRKMLGNGVPITMGRAIAKAVKNATAKIEVA